MNASEEQIHTLESATALNEYLAKIDGFLYTYYTFRSLPDGGLLKISLDPTFVGDVFVVQEGGIILKATVENNVVSFISEPDKFGLIYYRLYGNDDIRV